MSYIPHVQGTKHTEFGNLDATIMNSNTAITLVSFLEDVLKGMSPKKRRAIAEVIKYSKMARHSNQVLRNRRSDISKKGHDMRVNGKIKGE
tara:strand:+ start:119 stop:391 length:273 start_codon:yes stop_codon:yes gene_type:complete